MIKLNKLSLLIVTSLILFSCSENDNSDQKEPDLLSKTQFSDTSFKESSAMKLKTLNDDEHGFILEHPETWTVEMGDLSNLKGKYGLDALKYYKLKCPDKTYELRIYVLGNPDRKAISEFLTVKKESKKSKIEYVIPRAVYEEASVAYVEAGYSYDPPHWGMIKAEIESIHALTPDKFVYMQLSVAKQANPYIDMAKALIASLSATDKK